MCKIISLIIDLLFPMAANWEDNKKLRAKIKAQNDDCSSNPIESILSTVKKPDDLATDVFENLYNDTLKAKDKIEEKAKTNIIGVSISITLIMGASGMLSALNEKFQISWFAWVAFILMLAAVIYMLFAGILVIRLLTNENEVYTLDLNSFLPGSNSLMRKEYDRCIILNRYKNIIRNNYLFTSYECIRNSFVCLFAILVMTTIPLPTPKGNQNIVYVSDHYSFRYSSSSVEYLKQNDVQKIVESYITSVVENKKSNAEQTFGVVEEDCNLFIKFDVTGSTINVLLLEPISK